LSGRVERRYYLNLSHSVPVGLYKISSLTNYKTGDLVIFEPPQAGRSLIYKRRWLPNGWSLIKHIGALPGDAYSIQKGSFSINGKYAGPVFERDTEGKALPYRGGRYKVERNTFLPISTHISNSFDGRYFGTVSLTSIKGKAIPIWMF
jgi:conjugative transfer signal peptidase TraF